MKFPNLNNKKDGDLKVPILNRNTPVEPEHIRMAVDMLSHKVKDVNLNFCATGEKRRTQCDETAHYCYSGKQYR